MTIEEAASRIQERSAHVFNDGASEYEQLDAEVEAEKAVRMLLVGYTPTDEVEDAVAFLENLTGGLFRMLSSEQRTPDSVMATMLIALTQAFAVGSAQHDD